MKYIKKIIVAILTLTIIVSGAYAPLTVSAATVFPSETNAFGTDVYIDTINKDKPFFDEVLPEIRANIAENNKHSITKYYDSLPVANNPENFQGLGHTTYANINGKTVTAEAFYRYHNESLSDPNNGMGLLIYQCIEYKRAHPEEDVKITFSSYRTSVTASVCVIPESRYYGYMRSLYTTNYDEHGFVRISYMLLEAARMGIEVTLVNQLNSYSVAQYSPAAKKTKVRAPLSMKTYFNRALKSECYNKYAKGKNVSDFMNCTIVDWTVDEKTCDMQHIKSATVSHYLATDGSEHTSAVFVSSANLDENNYYGYNGNNGSQAGCIVSDHDDLYRVTYNYMQLMTKYKGQEEIYKLRKLVNEMNDKQIALIRAGREEEIPRDEQIVYLGSETDKVFEMYFTPLGGSADSWDTVKNPFCKYFTKFSKSEDYVELYWNEFGFGSDYNCRLTEKLVTKAFCDKPNVNNKFSISISDFDSKKIEELKLGREIAARSIKDGTSIHSKDILLSYQEKGVRHKVSLITSCNYYMVAFNYRTNSALVINETEESGGNYYDILAEKYSYQMVNNELMISPSNIALKTGEIFNATVVYSGENKLKWSVENPEVAKVDDGVITALSKGNTKITVTDGVYTSSAVLKVSDCIECIYASGLSCNINEQCVLGKKLTTVPVAMSAIININKADLKSTNVIFSCDNGYDPALTFYINKSGNVCVRTKSVAGDSTKYNTFVFDKTQVAVGRNVHVAFTFVPNMNRINCYIDGVWKQWHNNIPATYSFSEKNNYIVGGDYTNGNPYYFPGDISSVAAWSAPGGETLFSSEIKNGIDLTNSSLMFAYDFVRCAESRYNDLSTNQNHLEQIALWQDKDKVEPVGEYDYSFAVIGDTQTMCEEDPEAMESIYDWLVENKDSEKIEYVMGLGDITDDSTDGEWAYATEYISKLNGVIPYSLARGNHDDWDDFNRNLHNGYYETTVDGMMNDGDVELTDPNQPGLIETTLEDGSIGYITSEEDVPEGGTVVGDLTNSYRYLSVGGIDYLIMTLDFAPNEEMLAWADSVIEAHPNHRVIITTHAYMYRDGTTIDAGDLYPPTYYDGYDNAQNGDDMWEKCFSKHKNIVMVLSGHDPWQHIVYRQDQGVNGNLVTQMLIDPQYMDRNIGSTAMIAMLYFSNDSDTVTVRYYSVAKDCYGSVLSQFTVDLRDRKNDNENGDDYENDVDDNNGDNIGDDTDGNDTPNVDDDNQFPVEPETQKDEVSVTVQHYVGAMAPVSSTNTVEVDSEPTQMQNTQQPKNDVSVDFKLSATVKSTSATLKWREVDGAKKYKVYKYDTKTKKYKYLKTTTKTSSKISKLKSASTYKFKVKAYSKNGKLLDTTKICTVKTKPVTPTLKAKSKTKGTVTISWSKVKNAKGYQIYYSSSKNGKYKKLGTYTANKKTAKLKTGKTYYIKVRSYYKKSDKANYSSFSKPKKVKIK